MKPQTMQILCTSFWNQLYSEQFARLSYVTLHIKVTVKQKNVRLLMAFFRRAIQLNRS